jgi:prolyl oligopeptidase
MENMKSVETSKWVNAEDELLQSYIAEVPQREAMHRRIRELTSTDLYGKTTKEGGRYFFTKTNASGVASALYVQDNRFAAPHRLLDPATHGFGQNTRLSGFSPSPDGRLVAYSVSENQSDWLTVRVLDTARGADLPNVVLHSNRTSGGEVWRRDSKGFFYTQLNRSEGVSEGTAKLSQPRVYYYSLGDAKESLAYEPPNDPSLVVSYSVTGDGRYVVFSLGNGQTSSNKILYKDVNKPGDSIEDVSLTYVLGNQSGAKPRRIRRPRECLAGHKCQ